MTRQEFQEHYAKITGLSWSRLESYLQVVPCQCGKGNCPSWQMITLPTRLPPLQVQHCDNFPPAVRGRSPSAHGQRDFAGA